MDLLELAPQLPFEVRIDDRQRLVEQHRRYIAAHQPATERNLLLGIGCEARRTLVELATHIEHLGNLADALFDLVGRHLAVAQRKRQVFSHRHGVVDDRKLEHLRNIALLRTGLRHVTSVEADAAMRWHQQARHDVEHGRLAAARGAQQGVGAAIAKTHLEWQQRVVAVLRRVGPVGVRQIEVDAGHVSFPSARRAPRPVGLPRRRHRHVRH